ncbi:MULTISPECIES: hypothetical protein [Acidobacteriaceae]|uniref:hypothetical protein n=1 Tax=Acidobacteriaceae TaxID=204434 RepID=UPI00131C7E2E|nr:MULTISPECIES: hypothetical protein [Acidobacteriaceae]MDW5267765.1 hypothetical protein [Edaphobacter sp.]
MWQQVHSALSQSAHRVLFKLASFLPGLLALLVAVIVLALVGAALAAMLRRILVSAKFDERMARNSTDALSDWSPSGSPTLLVARIVFWACVVLGFIIGISAFDASSNGSQISTFLLPYLTHSVGAIVLLIIGNLIARFLERSVLIGAVNARLQYARFLSLGIKWLVLVLTAAMVLDHLEIGGAIVELAFGILFGGIVLTLALAVGLGSREMVSRSLEKNVERTDPNAATESPAGSEPLRHF